MKFAIALTILFAVASHARSINDKPIQPKGILDGVIEDIINKARDKLGNKTIDELTLNINTETVQGSITIRKAIILNLENFEIKQVDTTLIPLAVKNITIELNNINITGEYDINLKVQSDDPEIPSEITGSGAIQATFNGIWGTIHARVKLEDGKPQIIENGLIDLEVALGTAEVRLENVLGGGEAEAKFEEKLKTLLPDIINSKQKQFIDDNREKIRTKINELLKNL